MHPHRETLLPLLRLSSSRPRLRAYTKYRLPFRVASTTKNHSLCDVRLRFVVSREAYMSTGRISRRQFMVKSAGAAGALAAARTVRLGRERPEWERVSQTVAASDRVRFGMIGVGMQGSGLMANSIRLPGVECAAACDLYDGRHSLAKEIAGPTVNLPTTRRYKELLDNKDIDCI